VVVRFEPNTAPVPYISEMAEGRAAKAIINRAIEKGVPLYEDIPFARALFATGEVNTHMPLELSEKIVPFIYWLQSNHPDRVFDKPEFNNIHTRIGDVKR
jgi:type III secretion protein U